MRLFFYILFYLFSFKISYGQTIIRFDNMESTSTWKGISTVNINSFFTGGLSLATDNPPNYAKYSSSDSCYTIFGSGLGSSSIEVDTFIYPNIPLISGNQYQIKFKDEPVSISRPEITNGLVDIMIYKDPIELVEQSTTTEESIDESLPSELKNHIRLNVLKRQPFK